MPALVNEVLKARSIDEIRNLVACNICNRGDEKTKAYIETVAQHIKETGVNVWHACATISGTKCHCAHCTTKAKG